MSETNRWSYQASTWSSLKFEGPLPVNQLEAELLPLYRDVVAEWHVLKRTNANLFVPGSWPRLWFGDLEAYARSRVRVLTVSLNPSGNDFRPERKSEPNRLHNSCSVELAEACRRAFETDACWSTAKEFAKQFFETGRPDQWFSGYRHVLRSVTTPEMAGLDFVRPLSGDFDRGAPSSNHWITPTFPHLDPTAGVALHTDICSPYATDKLWSELSPEDRALLASGPEYFGKLVDALKPNFILMSLADKHWRSLFDEWPVEEPVSVRPWKGALLVAGGGARNSPYREWTKVRREALGAWMGFEASRQPKDFSGNDEDCADLGHNGTPFFSEGGAEEEVVFDD